MTETKIHIHLTKLVLIGKKEKKNNMRSRREKVARIASIKTLTCLINELKVDCVLLQVKCELKTIIEFRVQKYLVEKKVTLNFITSKNVALLLQLPKRSQTHIGKGVILSIIMELIKSQANKCIAHNGAFSFTLKMKTSHELCIFWN